MRRAARLTCPSFIVIGGGVDGARMVRQLLRARAAGRLETGAIVGGGPRSGVRGVVPRAARHHDGRPTGTSGWPRISGRGIRTLTSCPTTGRRTCSRRGWRGKCGGRAAPPSAAAPSLLASCRSSARPRPAIARFPTPPGPARRCASSPGCARTRAAFGTGALPPTSSAPPSGDAADESIVFRTIHLTYGVARFPFARSSPRVIGWSPRFAAGRRRTFVVATSSHCHALAATMRVSPVTT